jgi:hypothetical protein
LRHTVALEISGLGLACLPKGHKWDSLSFGWSLSDVVAMSQSAKQALPTCDKIVEEEVKEECKPEKDEKKPTDSKPKDKKSEKEETEEEELNGWAKAAKEPVSAGVSLAEALLLNKHLGYLSNFL